MSLRGRHLHPTPPPRRHSPAVAAYRFAVVAVPGAVLMTTLILTMGIGEDLSTRWEGEKSIVAKLKDAPNFPPKGP